MSVLPELKSGEIIRASDGATARVRRIRKPRGRVEYDEPMYKLTYLSKYGEATSSKEYTLDELARMNFEVAAG